ncbi:MAG: tRNA 2-thiouridine(34) synthase MnmA [Planctomycetota bacterium]|nr:tRNA 2-thiouridine(34) synthase MnmA [Planctomycetota bacterium]
MKVLVGLSGGVDSAVTAALLKRRGCRVAGATMSLWRDGRYRGGGKDACFGPGEKEDIEAAAEVSRILDIPHAVVDCSDAYERMVVEHFRAGYRAGRTPNPCVRCNGAIKFGLLPRLAKKAGMDFEYFATGHYARLIPGTDRMRLHTGRDGGKDQAYFLYRLGQKQLRTALMPLGEFGKHQVRRMALEFGLPVHDRPDSQDFYSGDHRELLRAGGGRGRIVHASGRCLGRHEGVWNFTIGQRKGLGVSHPTPLYVVEINPERNEIVVGDADAATSHALTAVDVNWVSIPPPESEFTAGVKVRSSGRAVPCRVFPAVGGFHADFPDGIFGVAPGQSAVLYQGDMVLGGGIIDSAK